jgi:hypothetical protein
MRALGLRFSVVAVAVACGLLVAVSGAQAAGSIVFDGAPGTGAPPASMGGYAMVSSPQDTRSDYTNVTSAPATASSSFAFNQSMQLYTIPSSWCSTDWAGGGYSGRVYYSAADSVTITLPSPEPAVDFYAEPNEFGTYDVTVSAKAPDGSSVSSGPIATPDTVCFLSGPSAHFFGFYGTGGESISSVTVSSPGTEGFGVGDFAIEQEIVFADVPSDMTVYTTATGHPRPVSYTPPTASYGGASVPVSCSPPSGATFPIGTTTVTCTATDIAAPNSPASVSFTVTVAVSHQAFTARHRSRARRRAARRARTRRASRTRG